MLDEVSFAKATILLLNERGIATNATSFDAKAAQKDLSLANLDTLA
jgi:hypothetical protein